MNCDMRDSMKAIEEEARKLETKDPLPELGMEKS